MHELQMIYRGTEGKFSRWCLHNDEDRHVGVLTYKGEQQWACVFSNEDKHWEFEAADADAALDRVRERYDAMETKPSVDADEVSPVEEAYINLVNGLLEASHKFAIEHKLEAAHGRALSMHVAMFAMNTTTDEGARKQIIDFVGSDAVNVMERIAARSAALDAVKDMVGNLLAQGGLQELAAKLGGGVGVVVAGGVVKGNDDDKEEHPQHTNQDGAPDGSKAH